MNNATYFSGRGARMKLEDAFVKFCAMTGRTTGGRERWHLFKFVQSPAMKCLDHDVGEVVQINTDKGLMYGTVYKYHDHAFDLDNGPDAEAPHYLYVMTKYGSYGVFTEDLKMPEFPQGLVDLVKAQLQSSCPLKEAACR